MVRSEFGGGKENTTIGIIACAALCFAAYAINPILGMVMAAMIAAGVILTGGKKLITGNAARP